MPTSITWFPGHMAKALATLKRLMKGVDLVMEVRDARVPLSSANPALAGLLGSKRHIIVLNKSDLVDARDKRAVLKLLEQQGALALATNSGSPESVRKLLDTAVGWVQRERRQSELSVMMVVGLPNSGKSSLINALKLSARQAGLLDGEQAFQKRASTGPKPGLTRQVSGFQVCGSPLTYVLDTPGIMVPAVPSDEVGMRLALAGAIKDSIIGEEALVSHLLALLASSPKHKAALHKATSVTHAEPGSPQMHRMRTALLAAASAPPAMLGESADLGGIWDDMRPGSSSSSSSSSRGSRGSGRSSSRGLSDEVGDDDGGGSGSVLPPAAAPLWHPGQEDASHDPGSERLELLMSQLGAGGAVDPGRRLAWHVKILAACRAGALGRMMLDDVAEGGRRQQRSADPSKG